MQKQASSNDSKQGESLNSERNHILSIPMSEHRLAGAPLMPERWLAEKLLSLAGSPPLALELWDGERIVAAHNQADFVLKLKDRLALYELMGNPNLAFGDLYSAGRLEVQGDLPDLLSALYVATSKAEQEMPVWLKPLWRNHAPRSTSVSDARNNIHHHYDLGNDFYRLWLDSAEMQYTCAYYESADMTLEQAQLAKLEHVCRKLQLKPGQTVVEAGCGWGGLARYMARHYGVKVRAFNISREQVRFAREQARQQGLSDQIEYVEDDYRNIQGQYDAFVSVGMLEHVGVDTFPVLADVVKRSLKPHGMALLHSIGRNQPSRVNAWIEKRIFPGGYPPSITEMMGICEAGNFSVLDVENLRLHYAQTLEHWLERFDQSQEAVIDMYDESFVRAWRLYLAGSIAAFKVGSLQLFQAVFTHAENNEVPRNRRHLYETPARPAEGDA